MKRNRTSRNARKPPPRGDTTNATRQMRLRERRKAEGFKRISVWLSPEQISVLQYLGGEPWLGRTVKAILEETL